MVVFSRGTVRTTPATLCSHFCFLFGLWSFLWCAASATNYTSNESSVLFQYQKNASQMISDLLSSTKYDRRFRPKFGAGETRIGIRIHVQQIGALNAETMDFSVSFIIGQYWNDQRLAYMNTINQDSLTLNGDILNQVWKPDTYVLNEKSSEVMKDQFLFRVKRNGDIYYSQRMTVTATCSMNYRNFPMDRQRCGLSFGSYGYVSQELEYYWGNRSLQFVPNMSLSYFVLVEHDSFTVNQQHYSGEYCVLGFTVTLRRKTFPYVVQAYIPTILIVGLSWIAFWIPRYSPPARVGLGITTVLALTTLVFGIQSKLPKVSYVKGIDWFLMVSFMYVFLALVEYPSSTFVRKQTKKVVRQGTKVMKKVRGRQITSNNAVSGVHDRNVSGGNYIQRNSVFVTRNSHVDDDCCVEIDQYLTNGRRPSLNKANFMFREDGFQEKRNDFTNQRKDNVVDMWAKVLFPLTYIIFNAFYWSVYLTDVQILPAGDDEY